MYGMVDFRILGSMLKQYSEVFSSCAVSRFWCMDYLRTGSVAPSINSFRPVVFHLERAVLGIIVVAVLTCNCEHEGLEKKKSRDRLSRYSFCRMVYV